MKKRLLLPAPISLLVLLPMAIMSCNNSDNVNTDKPDSSKPTPDNSNNELLDPAGGIIGQTKLKTSAYRNLITSLNLFTETTYLPSINNQILQDAIKDKPELKDLTLTIKNDSNTLNGILNLELKTQTLETKNIKIEGFNSYQLTNNPSLQYHSFQLNLSTWFDNQLPIKTTNNLETLIKQINSEQWNAVLDDFKIISTANFAQSVGNAQQLKENGFNFEIKSFYDSKSQTIKLIITTKFIHKKYQDTKWIAVDQISIWNQASNKDSVLQLLTRDELQQFIIDQTIINENELKNYVPSYYLGKAYYYQSINGNGFSGDTSLFTNQYVANDDFIKYYFGKNSHLAITFDQNSVSANDWKNTLALTILLVLDGEIVNGSKNIKISGKNKEIQTILNNKLNENNVQFLPSSSLKDKISEYLKTNYKSDLDQIFGASSGTVKEINIVDPKLIQQIIQQIGQPMLNYESEERTRQLWTAMEKQIQLSFFGQEQIKLINESLENKSPNTLNFSSHLFQMTKDDAFVVEHLQYKFDDNNLMIKLTNLNPNTIKIELLGQTLIEFAGDGEANQNIFTNFFFNLHKKEIEI